MCDGYSLTILRLRWRKIWVAIALKTVSRVDFIRLGSNDAIPYPHLDLSADPVLELAVLYAADQGQCRQHGGSVL